MRCFCPAVLCDDHCHVHLFQCQEGEEEGYGCAERGQGGSAEEEIWVVLIGIAVVLGHRGGLGLETRRMKLSTQTGIYPYNARSLLSVLLMASDIEVVIRYRATY